MKLHKKDPLAKGRKLIGENQLNYAPIIPQSNRGARRSYMNYYINRYNELKGEFEPLQAFQIVAGSIAHHGTLDDLKQLDKAYQSDIYRKWGIEDERTRELAKVSGQ